MVITAFYEHHHWANMTLVSACEALTIEQRSTSIEATYGTIMDTWRHLASTQQAFVEILTGETTADLDGDATLAQVRESMSRSSQALITVAHTFSADSSVNAVTPSGRSVQLPAWAFLLQCLDHGNEHRQHIRMTMNSLGITAPTIDTWSYLASRSV